MNTHLCTGKPLNRNDLSCLTVAEIMSDKILHLSPTHTVLDARNLMDEAYIRHLPILDDSGALIGIVSQRDVCKASVSQLAGLDVEEVRAIEASIPLADIMTTHIMRVTPDMLVTEAAGLMLRYKFGCLPIMVQGQLTGILTESDFISLTVLLLQKNATGAA